MIAHPNQEPRARQANNDTYGVKNYGSRLNPALDINMC